MSTDLPAQKRLKRRADMLKALAHPSRLLILELLEERPHHVGELRTAVGADLTTVSKHLAVLRKVGIVRVRRQGTYSWYHLVCGCVNRMIDCIETSTEEAAGPD